MEYNNNNKKCKKRKCAFCNNLASLKLYDNLCQHYIYICNDCYNNLREDGNFSSISALETIKTN